MKDDTHHFVSVDVNPQQCQGLVDSTVMVCQKLRQRRIGVWTRQSFYRGKRLLLIPLLIKRGQTVRGMKSQTGMTV